MPTDYSTLDVALCVVAASRLLAGIGLAADVGVAVMVGPALAYLQREGERCKIGVKYKLRRKSFSGVNSESEVLSHTSRSAFKASSRSGSAT